MRIHAPVGQLRRQRRPQRVKLLLIATLKRSLHQHQLLLRIDDDVLAAQAAQRERAAVRHEKPHLIAVSGRVRAKLHPRGPERRIRSDRGRRKQPLRRDDLAALPVAVMGQHQAEPRPVAQHGIHIGERDLLAGGVDDPACIRLGTERPTASRPHSPTPFCASRRPARDRARGTRPTNGERFRLRHARVEALHGGETAAGILLFEREAGQREDVAVEIDVDLAKGRPGCHLQQHLDRGASVLGSFEIRHIGFGRIIDPSGWRPLSRRRRSTAR